MLSAHATDSFLLICWSKMLQNYHQDSPKWSQISSKMLQNEPKKHQDATKMTPSLSKGGWEGGGPPPKKKRPQRAPKWSKKGAHGETHDGNSVILSKNEYVKKQLCFSLYLKPRAPIYEPCWVILGSCCRPTHALIHH